jgi:acyl transferase domain-containing protein
MTPRRALIVVPGRGSYGRDSLGSLRGLDSPALDAFDGLRAALGRPTVREMDAATSHQSALHVAGEHASILTAGVSLADLEALDPGLVRPVAVVGNSMGWYTALGYAGALPLLDCGRLIETMGAYQAGNVIGGQLLYPLVGEDWRRDPARVDAVEAALRSVPDLHWSIRLGGQAVLGGTEAALAAATAALPKAQLGTTIFPMRLPLHSAFHTPLMAATSARAQVDLAHLGWRAPRLPLVDGAGRIWRPIHADPAGIRDYTLGEQVVQPFDLALALRVALREYAPELIVLPGPGSNLGGAIAQALIAEGWSGLGDREQFISRQSNAPVVIALRRPDQRPMAAR